MAPRDNRTDDLLVGFLAEEHPTLAQIARVVSYIITRILRLEERYDEMLARDQQEDTARIQVQQTKRSAFEWMQFGVTTIMALAMLAVAIIELSKR